MQLETLVWSLDPAGNIVVQQAQTADISNIGGCLRGLKTALEPGAIIGVQNGDRKARFRVVWNGNGNGKAGQAGLERLGSEQRSTKVLYVDDEPGSGELRRSVLDALGYDVTYVGTGSTALQMLSKESHDAVVLSHPLQDLDLEEILSGIRRSGRPVRIVLLSGFTTRIPDNVLELADATVHKRDGHAALVAAVEKAVGTNNRRRAVLTRHVRRYAVMVPVAVQVMRSGVVTTFHGMSVDLGEGGIGVRTKSQLIPGELVKVVFALPNSRRDLEAQALVRHKRSESFVGLEFASITPEAVVTIRAFCSVLPPLNQSERNGHGG